jgi:hypothetical protein
MPSLFTAMRGVFHKIQLHYFSFLLLPPRCPREEVGNLGHQLCVAMKALLFLPTEIFPV